MIPMTAHLPPTMTSVSPKRWKPLKSNKGRELSMAKPGWNLADVGNQPARRTWGNRVSS